MHHLRPQSPGRKPVAGTVDRDRASRHGLVSGRSPDRHLRVERVVEHPPIAATVPDGSLVLPGLKLYAVAVRRDPNGQVMISVVLLTAGSVIARLLRRWSRVFT